MNPVIGADGETEIRETNYDTKLRMIHVDGVRVEDLLDRSFEPSDNGT